MICRTSNMLSRDSISCMRDDFPQETDYTTDARAVLKPVGIPNNTYLWFAHAYEFEYSSAGNYDGGVLEYSTNSGLSWNDAGPLMEYNGYKGKIYGNYINPLKGRSAFVGSSHGYISTRLNLASLAGKNVNFRWRMGLDDIGTALGWWVDNIKVYTCGKSATFADVPQTHPYFNDIEILYANGLTGGCSTTPLKFCPDQIMDRAQAAVFMLRGNFGVWLRSQPICQSCSRMIGRKGSGPGRGRMPCSNDSDDRVLITPWKYCPWTQMPREQVVIFGLRMKYGTDYHAAGGHGHGVCRPDGSQLLCHGLGGEGLCGRVDHELWDERRQADVLPECVGDPRAGCLCHRAGRRT